MTESSSSSSWSDVGERFTHLGRTLQDSWSHAGDGARDEAAGSGGGKGGDGVRASLDGLADSITRTVHDEQVHASARSAAGGLVDALSSSLSDLADRIQTPKR